MALAVKPRQTVLFIGDSITDAHRATQSPPLGNGYVRIAYELFDARYPAHQIRFLNHGIGGHTICNLRDRWDADVLAHKPNWVSVKVGINDLWRWLARGDQSVSPEEFFKQYDQLITRTKKEIAAQIILVDPFFISTDFGADTDRGRVLKVLPMYLDMVESLAKKHKVRHVRTQQAFKKVLEYTAADALCPEPVHPYLSGHTVIAYRWLESIGW